MGFKFYAAWLAGICVLVFILQTVFSGFTELFLLNELSFSQPWRFVTAIFLHGGLTHLIYNLFALVLFGSMLERLVGSKRFLAVFFITGIGANLFSVFFYPSSLGASGAIFGIIGSLIVVRPTLVVFAFGLPMPMFIAGILWTAGDIIGAVGYFIGNPVNNTGNLAHLSGMAIGLLFGALYRDWRQRRIPSERIGLDEGFMRQWEDTHLK